MVRRAYSGFLSVLFVLLLLTPVLVMLVEPTKEISSAEKRSLASLPEFVCSISYFAHFPQEFERYFKDRFGLRDQLITLYNALFVTLFHDSPRRDVILGQDGWLFLRTDHVLEDFMGLRRKTQEGLAVIANTLENRQDWLAGQGIRYLFVPIPNKIQVYPEKLPTRFQMAGGEQVYSQITGYLSRYAQDVPLVHLLPVFLREKENHQIYYKSDTHWNEQGAFIAYEQIIAHLSQWFPELKPIPQSAMLRGTRIHQGDLAEILHLEKLRLEEAPSLHIDDMCGKGEYSRLNGAFQQNILQQKFSKGEVDLGGCPERKLRAVIIHDSFGNTLRNLLSQHFREAFFVTHASFEDMTLLIEREKPDVVIDMRVARYLNVALSPHIEIDSLMARKGFEQASAAVLAVTPATFRGQSLRIVNGEVSKSGGAFILAAGSRDPQLIFTLPGAEVKGTSIAHVSLHSPARSVLQLFFKSAPGQEFSEKRSVKIRIVKGDNELYFKVPSWTLCDEIRLDPGAEKGTYVLKRFELRQSNRSASHRVVLKDENYP